MRTRIPTLRREDCVSAGRGGDNGDVRREGWLEALLVLLALRWKKESMEGWYCRLRKCSVEAAGRAMVVVLIDLVILFRNVICMVWKWDDCDKDGLD